MDKHQDENIFGMYKPGVTLEPPERPVCMRSSECVDCPYPVHGFVCWNGEGECLRSQMRQLEFRNGKPP